VLCAVAQSVVEPTLAGMGGIPKLVGAAALSGVKDDAKFITYELSKELGA
jgi:hypothetical protein